MTIPEEMPAVSTSESARPEGGKAIMCCRACHGYETCMTQNELRDDCCPKCRYFEDCMESNQDEDDRTRPSPGGKRPYKAKR
jgi:hypothetical protein